MGGGELRVFLLCHLATPLIKTLTYVFNWTTLAALLRKD